MRIGSSIALIAVGLILALAVNLDVSGIDLTLVGWILAVVGAIGLIMSVAMTRRRRPVVEQAYVEERPVVERPVVERPVVRDEYPPRDY